MVCDGPLQPATGRTIKKASDRRWLVGLVAVPVNDGDDSAAARCWLLGGLPE